MTIESNKIKNRAKAILFRHGIKFEKMRVSKDTYGVVLWVYFWGFGKVVIPIFDIAGKEFTIFNKEIFNLSLHDCRIYYNKAKERAIFHGLQL